MREDVEDVADPARPGVGEMKAATVEALLVGDVVDRVHDEVDRHHVQAAAFEADRRHPGRQQSPQLLDRLEEVVGPVDLVHLAGARIADDDARTIDAPGPQTLPAYDAFGLVLGAEVRVLQVFGFLEHVLAEHAFVQAGSGDRAREVKAADSQRLRELDGIPRALDVGELLRLRARLEAVDRGEMKHVVDAAGHALQIRGRHPEARLRDIADDGNRPTGLDTPPREQGSDPLVRLLPDQKIHDVRLALEQLLREPRADEAGRTGQKITHCSGSSTQLDLAPPWHARAVSRRDV